MAREIHDELGSALTCLKMDLAWMAIGRLFYETNNYLDSVEAYSHVGRNSPEFSTTLYELASTGSDAAAPAPNRTTS